MSARLTSKHVPAKTASSDKLMNCVRNSPFQNEMCVHFHLSFTWCLRILKLRSSWLREQPAQWSNDSKQAGTILSVQVGSHWHPKQLRPKSYFWQAVHLPFLLKMKSKMAGRANPRWTFLLQQQLPQALQRVRGPSPLNKCQILMGPLQQACFV